MTSRPHVVVIGAGPTGLGAAWRLRERGHEHWSLYEAAPHPGGLASSVRDERGFTWDLGGHVLFSHYRYFDALMESALADQWVEHVREAWVWMRERWIPYPLQNNIWRLPQDELLACLDGLFQLRDGPASRAAPATFEEWLLRSFGRGLCESFLFPYNEKVWAHPPRLLGVGWMGERVAPVDLRRIVRNVVLQRDDAGWGPNATFRFPLRGGTGAIWRGVAAQLPASRLHFGRAVVRVDAERRRLELADGETVAYDALVSTLPLDALVRLLAAPGPLLPLADRFVHSSTHVVGVGFEGEPPPDLRTKCWIYSPEPETPFYRVTVFSNYSPNNVARPGQQWSLMAEVSESTHKPVAADRVVADTLAGFRRCGWVRDDTRVATTFHRRLPYGYPTPWRERDDVVGTVEQALAARDVLSRGRFGAWRYEVSNQDHSVMQGVEAVERLLGGAAEHTVRGDMRDWLEPAAAPGRGAAVRTGSGGGG